jgi:hypothetical protein
MRVLGTKYQNDWSIQKASDLTVEDPFYWWTQRWLYICMIQKFFGGIVNRLLFYLQGGTV